MRPPQQGAVLISVLTSLAIIAAVVYLLDLQQGMRAHSAAKQQNQAVAEALAEAGVRDALWRVRKSSSYLNPVTGALPGHGTYTARIAKDPQNPSKFAISSEGVTASNTRAELKRTYTLACPQGDTTTVIIKYGVDGEPRNITENSANNFQNGFFHPRNNTDNRSRSLLKFDYGIEPPANAIIASATLLLDVQQHDPAMEGATLSANRVIQEWVSKDADWKVAAPKKVWQSPDKTGGHFTLVDQGNATIAAGIDIYRIDITGIMQAWVKGTSNQGLIIRTDGNTTTGPTEFRLKRNTGSTNTHWPRLEVKWCNP